ncbi:MAG: arginine N-succinyltransferase [Robiginitomaculum sp.]|nr:arginine N-succinyltransferase [Robiginitomaculum sp.]
MLRVRPARLEDLDDLIGLARLAGPGFTSLAVSDEDLETRLGKSVDSFALKTDAIGDQIYLLMLEDMDTGEVVGLSAVKSLIGHNKPFFNFKLLNIVQSSSVADRHFNMEIMLLVNEYSGASEVGTLFVHPKMRGTGAGRLISQARYMLIAANPTRFAQTVISELRGCVDGEGYSPFWESLGRKFFKMDFNEADKITAETDNQFITDLMPKYPIYKELLSDEAQEVIGKTHPDGKGARRLLETEGFRYENCIDIFDAGPTMAVPRDQIRTVKDSRVVKAKLSERNSHTHTALISNNNIENFKAVYTGINIDQGDACLSKDILVALDVKVGGLVRVYANRISK